MDNVLVINMTTVTQHVGVVHAGGQKDHVQVMPRRRVHLRTGMTVDPAWIGLNPNAIKVHEPTPAAKVAVAHRAEVVDTKLPAQAPTSEGAE